MARSEIRSVSESIKNFVGVFLCYVVQFDRVICITGLGLIGDLNFWAKIVVL